LIGLYFLFVLVKGILSYFVSTPTMFNDELLFKEMARSFWYHLNLDIFGEAYSWGRPLYPVIISIAYFFKSMVNIYTAMKIINVLLSSLIIFPAFLLAREFFGTKRSILVAILISVLPMNFAFSSYIMSENIFYVLFLFSIYFIYKALNANGWKWVILSGIFIGLCNLAKIQGLVLFPLIMILFLAKKRFKSLWDILMISLIIVTPYFLSAGVVGYDSLIYKNSFSLSSFIFWVLLYVSYIILASGVFAFLTKLDLKHLFFWIIFLSTGFLVAVASFHSSSYLDGRPIGRYVDAVIPLILIFGLFSLKNVESIWRKMITLGFVLFSFRLLSYSLFPVSDLMLSHVGVVNYLFGSWGAFVLILGVSMIYLLIKRLTIKKTIILLSVFFLSISLLCYAINIYNAKSWSNTDQVKAGLWLNDFDDNPDKTVLVDKDISLGIDKDRFLTSAFWINGNISVKELKDHSGEEYIITTGSCRAIRKFGDFRVCIS